MKRFNIKEAKAGAPVCTRNGKDVRIISIDDNPSSPYNIIVQVEGESIIRTYLNDGVWGGKDNGVCSGYDLMMKDDIDTSTGNGECTDMHDMTEHVNHPSHYNTYDVEVIDMMRRIWGDDAVRTFCVLNAFKYRMRAGHKEDVSEDLAKEKWYLELAKKLHGRDDSFSVSSQF